MEREYVYYNIKSEINNNKIIEYFKCNKFFESILFRNRKIIEETFGIDFGYDNFYKKLEYILDESDGCLVFYLKDEKFVFKHWRSHFESYKIIGKQTEAKTIDYFCEKVKQIINQKLEENGTTENFENQLQRKEIGKSRTNQRRGNSISSRGSESTVACGQIRNKQAIKSETKRI